MKKTALAICLFWVSHLTAQQNEIYSKEYISEIIELVNAYQSSNLHPNWNISWVRSTYYSGVISVFHATGEERYLNQCLSWGKELNWQIPDVEDNVYGSGFYSLGCGQIWLECYMERGQKYMLEPIISYLSDSTLVNPLSDPLKWYYENSNLRFIDGLYTSPPAFAMLYRITGEKKYLDWMDACFWDIYGALFDLEEGLYYRDIRYKKGNQARIAPKYIRPDSIPHDEARTTYIYQETENGKKVIWSRGNGWAFGGLTRIMKFLPTEYGNYERYKALFIQMANEIKERQQTDGFWRPNLADSNDYNLKESTGTSFFTYGIAWGINNGILSSDEFLPVVKKSWAALTTVVSEEGKVQWGQLSGGAPYKVEKNDSPEYGSGMFLLAAGEMFKLANCRSSN